MNDKKSAFRNIITGALGVGFSLVNVKMFVIFLNGKYIYEPNKIIATTELIVASALLLWFVYFLIWSVRHSNL